MRRRPLSINARWTLRYTAAMAVTLAIFSAYVYTRVERRLDNDARLLLRLQLAEFAEAIERAPDDPEAWRTYVRQHLEAADPELRLGVAVIGRDGTLRLAEGSLANRTLPVPREVAEGRDPQELRQVDVGRDAPFFVLSGRSGERVIQVAIDSKRFVRNAAHIGRVLVLGLIPALLLTALAGWVLSRRSLRPIAEITETARRISTTRLDERIPTTGTGDELDALASTLNDMVARIRSGMEGMHRFSVDAAHQLRTPLTALRSQIEVTLAQERGPEDYRRVLEDLLGQVERVANAVDGILRLARSEGGLDAARRTPVDIGAVLREAAEFFQPLADERDVKLELAQDGPLSVAGDATWLHQLFGNLLHNALEHAPPGGWVQVVAGRDGHDALVRVRDSGPGVPAEERERIFERFVRGERPTQRPGTGIGLAIAQEIARAHGGSVSLEEDGGAGACFAVRLPLAPPARSR